MPISHCLRIIRRRWKTIVCTAFSTRACTQNCPPKRQSKFLKWKTVTMFQQSLLSAPGTYWHADGDGAFVLPCRLAYKQLVGEVRDEPKTNSPADLCQPTVGFEFLPIVFVSASVNFTWGKLGTQCLIHITYRASGWKYPLPFCPRTCGIQLLAYSIEQQ